MDCDAVPADDSRCDAGTRVRLRARRSCRGRSGDGDVGVSLAALRATQHQHADGDEIDDQQCDGGCGPDVGLRLCS